MRATIIKEELIVSDLRMGLEPHYNFNFVIARQGDHGHWEPLAPARQLPDPVRASVTDRQTGSALTRLWQRIWSGSGEVLEMP